MLPEYGVGCGENGSADDRPVELRKTVLFTTFGIKSRRRTLRREKPCPRLVPIGLMGFARGVAATKEGSLSFLIRCLGMLILAAGVVFGVGDIARSLAGEAVELLTVSQAAVSLGFPYEPSLLSNPIAVAVMANVGSWSMALTAGGLGLLLLVLGRKRHVRSAARYAH